MYRITILNLKDILTVVIVYTVMIITILVLIMNFFNSEALIKYLSNNLCIPSIEFSKQEIVQDIFQTEMNIQKDKIDIEKEIKNFIAVEQNDEQEIDKAKDKDKDKKEYNIEIKPDIIEFKNNTNYEIDVLGLLNSNLNILSNDKIPTILIIHTHGSESYYGETHTDYYRTEDINHNVVKVGTELANCLFDLGYKVIHDTNIYDYPTYSGSYTRSLSSIQENIINNKDIQIVLDIHRDAMESDEFYSPRVNIEGEDASKIMIIVGTDAGGLPHDNWKENLKLALNLYNVGEQMYSGIYRPMRITNSRYNQHITNGTLILEVGATGNTLKQSINSMKYFSEILDVTLKDFLGGII